MIGQTISHYRILEKLGGGGMGVVYKAQDTRLDRPVALKFLPPDLTRDPEARERFIHEAKAASALQHPNICTIHDVDETADNQLFIVMDCYEGQTLGKMIEGGPLAIDQAINITIQIAQGLQKAHKQGIVHRDIKPANIIITNDDVAKILDFGLAKLAGQAKLTKTGSTIGTAAYMSPEQAQGEEIDHRTDIWSLGVVLFEMLTGKLPFRGEHEAALLYSVVHEEPQAIYSLRTDIPPNVASTIAKMLQKRPGERFQDIEGLLSQLSSARTKDESESKKSLPSIAVLPFVNMSADPENDYFSDGLAEELINALSKLGDLHLVARTSAFQFRGKDVDIREVGRQLNVSTVLEGSVRKAGNRLRITAQLINVADGYHLWSERFDRNIKDVFAVQDEIAMAVVEKLKVELLKGEKEKVTKRYTRDEKAYQLYLRGRYHWNKRYPRAMLKAVEFFQRAIDKDPGYALPYVGIADVFNMLAEFGFVPPQDAYLKSRTLLQKAQEIDDSLSELYVSLGLITYCFEWDLPAAERYVRRSIELNPQNWYAHGTRAEILVAQGRWEEAHEEVNKAMELDPLSSIVHALFGIVLIVAGRVEEGREALSKTIAMEPDQPMLHNWMGIFSLTHPVMPEKAIEHLQKAFDLGVSPACGYLGVAYALADRKEEALRCLEMLERIEKERFIPLSLKLLFYLKPGLRRFQSFKRKYVPPYLKAIIYCGLKMEEEALGQFEKSGQARDYLLPAFFSIAERYPWMSELLISPRLQALRAKIKTA